MADRIYRTKIDFRVLSDKLEFSFFISGSIARDNVRTTTNTSYNKTKCFTLTYDTSFPVDAVVKVSEKGEQRLFLKFDKTNLIPRKSLNLINIRNTDLILEVFKNSKGLFGFERIKGGQWGAFLSHNNYFDTKSKVTDDQGQGALKPFGKVIGGKTHAIQMVVPGIILGGNKNNLSFDMDIYSEYCGQYNTSLGFKLNLEEELIIEGEVIGTEQVKQVINTPKEIRLDTTYLNLTQKDLASREVVYDYKTQLTKQNVDPESLTLLGSEIYAIENNVNNNVDLESLNLTDTNTIDIPYNVSRVVEDGVIKECGKILQNGREVYPINWVSEIRDNEIYSSADKCISMSFATKSQLLSFNDKLVGRKIGNIETYPTINERGGITNVDRTYSKITQWVDRTMLDQFNDVNFGYDNDSNISSITVCPRKSTNIGLKNSGRQNGLYTSGGEFTLNGGDYVGYYHIDGDGTPATGKDRKWCWVESGKRVGMGCCKRVANINTAQACLSHSECHKLCVGQPIDKFATNSDDSDQTLEPLFTTVPISASSTTDFYFTTFNKTNDTYSAFTTGNTFDIHLSGDTTSISATSIPITNIDRVKTLPMIDDVTKKYRPYAFSEVYSSNGGYLVLDENTPSNYITYTVKTDGVYRFMYKAYLNIEYSDNKWCAYLETEYPSGTTGNYPSTDYEIKRLINTSIIQAGSGETEVVLQDTNQKYHPGYKFKTGREGVEGIPDNTGILKFNLNVDLTKTVSGGTQTTLKNFNILRAVGDGTANDYLTLDVTSVDKGFSGFNICIQSASTGTIFSKQIPVTLDTGFINLLSGDTVQLTYDVNWESSSKLSGATNIDINLGHKLDYSGGTIESPWFRVIKSSTSTVNKNLFFDTGKESKAFEMVVNGSRKTVKMDGALYLSDNKCGNLTVPTVNNNTFNTLTFLDTTGGDGILKWDVKSDKSVNQWQKMIETNSIKDYVITQGKKNTLTNMTSNGVFRFYLPTYNSTTYGAKCNFNFPQISQSYVVVNKFKNYFGGLITHYIVVTPTCDFHKPCSGTKVISAYDILHKTTPDKWKVVNINKKLTIGGKEITVVSNKSHYNPTPTTLPKQTSCKYYCKCGQDLAEQLSLDPIYGTTNILTDLESEKCVDCLKNANNYCLGLNKRCKPVLVGDCKPENDYLEQLNNGERITKTKGSIPVTKGDGDVIPPPPEGPGDGGGEEQGGSSDSETYSCVDGTCFKDPSGIYSSLTECLRSCVSDGSEPCLPEECGEGYVWDTNLCKCVKISKK